jgi:hypothetical protein
MDLFGKVHQLVDYGLSFHQKAVFLVDFSRGSSMAYHSMIVYAIEYDILATFSLTPYSSTHSNKVIETKPRY